MSDIPNLPFVTACLSGEAFEADVDDWVEAWHEHAGAPLGRSVPLYEYLGMSDAEYDLWVEQSSALRLIVSARRYGVEVTDLLQGQSEYALAARSASDPAEVAKVVDWLVDSGQLPSRSTGNPSN
jgi:hypothetical protein